jgi:hypothetical protein
MLLLSVVDVLVSLSLLTTTVAYVTQPSKALVYFPTRLQGSFLRSYETELMDVFNRTRPSVVFIRYERTVRT